MAIDVVKAYGAEGRDDLIKFTPEALTIIVDPKHPLFDERALLPAPEALILNVMAVGVQEPVIVRKEGLDPASGRPIVAVVDGRQRVRAAIEANRRLSDRGCEPILVPAVRARGDDAFVAGIMVATGIKVESTVLRNAKRLQALMGLGKSIAECAVLFGVSEQTIRNWIALLDCAPEIQRAVDRGDLPATVAQKISKLSRDEQRARYEGLRQRGLTRGRAALEAASRPSVEEGRDARAPRMLGRPLLERITRSLEGERAGDHASAEVVAVLRFVLGDARALGACPARFRDAVKAAREERPSRAKHG